MREFNTKIQETDTVEIVAQAAVNKEVKLIGSQRKILGHTLFQYDLNTQKLSVAEYKKQDLVLENLSVHSLKISHKVDFKENCIYLQALNRKNALKRLNRDYGIVVAV